MCNIYTYVRDTTYRPSEGEIVRKKHNVGPDGPGKYARSGAMTCGKFTPPIRTKKKKLCFRITHTSRSKGACMVKNLIDFRLKIASNFLRSIIVVAQSRPRFFFVYTFFFFCLSRRLFDERWLFFFSMFLTVENTWGLVSILAKWRWLFFDSVHFLFRLTYLVDFFHRKLLN